MEATPEKDPKPSEEKKAETPAAEVKPQPVAEPQPVAVQPAPVAAQPAPAAEPTPVAAAPVEKPKETPPLTGPQLILKQLEDAIQQTPPPPAEPVPPPPLEPSPAAESPAPPEPSAPVEPVSKISIHVNAAPAAAPVDSSKIKMTEAMLKLDAVVKELKEKNK